MAGARHKGSLGTDTNRPVIDKGTAVRIDSPLPGNVCVTRDPSIRNRWNWGGWHIARWVALPSALGGGKEFLYRFKDMWVVGHKETILRYSRMYRLPPLLLAGVAWSEVGGKPDWIDVPVYEFRKFDHSGDPFLEPLTITRKPGLTSFGDVQIQLRRAAETLGLDFEKLDSRQREMLLECLSDEENNLAIVAKHLSQLKNIDFPGKADIGDEEIRIIGARYNRGPHLTLEVIKRNTSYGNAILSHKARLLKLLK